jgi:hypothetical protein
MRTNRAGAELAHNKPIHPLHNWHKNTMRWNCGLSPGLLSLSGSLLNS